MSMCFERSVTISRTTYRTVRLFLLAALVAGCGPRLPDRLNATAPSVVPVIEGDVVGQAGEPIPGALVSASSHFDLLESEPAHDERADSHGHFRFAKLPPGRYGVTATCADHAAAYGGLLTVASGGPAARVELRVGGPSAAIEGTVRDERGAPLAGVRVLAPALSENEHEVYVTYTDVRGHYLLRLPTKYGYFVVADASPRPRSQKRVEPVSQVVDLALAAPPAPRPSDGAIAGWLRAHATPLAGDRDLDEAAARAFGAIVGDAPLVAMGEATHGSAEFPEWRRRVFQALVRDKGFTVYAVEVGWADAFALDDYVVNGKGDPRAAIRELMTWKDETEETLALVRWMRAYNADPSHTRKVHFEGFDVLTPHAVPALLTYLQKVDPAAVEDAKKALAPFVGVEADATYPALPKEERDRTRHAVDALVTRMDANHAAYAARSSEDAWARGQHLARMVQQAEVSYGDYSARDAQMVENIRWLAGHHPPGTKMLLDAHNSHIAAEEHELSYMGRLLRESFGARYVSIGFAFGEGSLHALDWQKGPSNVRGNFSVGRAPLGTFDGDLSLADLAAFVVDLRGIEGPVGAWLRSPQRTHSIGGRFYGPEHAFEAFTPARAFDAIIYLDKISAIHPLSREN
jgi:erythromycin esterase